MKAGVDANLLDGACIFFEPDVHSLEAHGLGAPESVLTVCQQGKVLNLDPCGELLPQRGACGWWTIVGTSRGPWR